jgi:protein gp37
MGEMTKISWTHSTFQPWIGCDKVSPACKHCYAELVAKRMGHDAWGAKAPRIWMAEDYWRQPAKWNAKAAEAGQRRRVFCASLADVFENREDVVPHRQRLFSVIDETPWLDWLLLTKRPQNIVRMIPSEWNDCHQPRRNVWYGTTVENQEEADRRIPELVKVPAAVRFLSCEPLLEPVDLTKWLPTGRANWQCQKCGAFLNSLAQCRWCGASKDYLCGSHAANRPDPSNKFSGYCNRQPLDWVIVGGESGGDSRPMRPAWARQLLAQCRQAGIAFHFKQWGNWMEWDHKPVEPEKLALFATLENGEKPIIIKDLAEDRRENWAETHEKDDVLMERTTVKRAGRKLDGEFYDEYPVVRLHEPMPTS